MAAPAASSMFDAEVVSELRRQFDAADVDGNGEVDAREACRLFARSCAPGASEQEVEKTANSLQHQLDTDRSGTISFDEYCFRFGRRYQMELNRRKRAGANAAAVPAVGQSGADEMPADAAAASNEAAGDVDKIRREQEELEKAREALRREREELQREREQAEAERREARERREAQETREGRQQQDDGTDSRSNGGSAFAVGTRVRLQGLQGAPELNGQVATVLRFDAAAGRYVVELAGGGFQKSLRPGNLAPFDSSPGGAAGSGGAGGPGIVERAQAAFRKGCAHVQVWVASSGYEWWQLLLGAGVVLLVAVAWAQNSARYAADTGRSASSGRAASSFGTDGAHSHGGRGSDTFGDEGGTWDDRSRRQYDRWDSDTHDDHAGRHRGGRAEDRYDDYGAGAGRGAHGRRGRYDDYDGNGGYGGYGHGGGDGLLSGLLAPLGLGPQAQYYVIIGVLGFLCWKGIIPVHRMSWFQMYMLWQMIEPMLLGGRRRGGYGGGYYGGGFGGPFMRPRRFF